jgi:hypothetical protein
MHKKNLFFPYSLYGEVCPGNFEIELGSRRFQNYFVRGPFEKFVERRQCAAVMQREAVTYAKL